MAKKISTQPERPLDNVTKPLTKFARDSYNLVNRCTKPTLTEFKKIATVTAVGFLVMGVIGFGIKLIHIPINTILVGSQ